MRSGSADMGRSRARRRMEAEGFHSRPGQLAVSWAMSPGPAALLVLALCLGQTAHMKEGKPGLKSERLYLLLGLSVAFLLCFLLLFWLLQKQQGFLRSNGQQQKPRERLSPGTDGLERIPDTATADRLPGMDIRKDTLTSAAGGPQEVTYTQLDHRVLTQKASPTTVSPQGEETTAESSMYATLARR